MLNKRHRLLIIEDNEINCDILREILQEDYTLLFANNGKDGLDMMRKHYNEIDVTLLDIQMPVMDGYEVLKAKGKEPLLKDIPVIVTTGGTEEVRCLELGAQDFVRKPYDTAVVRLRIESIINLRESNEANRQKTLFIQNISHEIRTPMNSIMGFAQLMEGMSDSLTTEDIKNFCSNITTSSHNLMDMINNMVALSSFDSGNITMNIAEVSPNRICRQAIELASYSAQAGVRTSFTSDIDDSLLFFTDAKYLAQALYNLIANANKFTKQGEIDIHCSMKQDALVISVTDTGIGVPQDKTEWIFERFSKIDDFVPGMGLGLTIVRKIADSLNGTAYLDTSYTNGSRFIIELTQTDNI